MKRNKTKENVEIVWACECDRQNAIRFVSCIAIQLAISTSAMLGMDEHWMYYVLHWTILL